MNAQRNKPCERCASDPVRALQQAASPFYTCTDETCMHCVPTRSAQDIVDKAADTYTNRELLSVALCYVQFAGLSDEGRDLRRCDHRLPGSWPMVWYGERWTPSDDNTPAGRIRELEEAQALIAAEIRRLQRQDAATPRVGICFGCGQPMRQAVTGKPVKGVERRVDGNTVRLHKTCADTFDADNRQETAREFVKLGSSGDDE